MARKRANLRAGGRPDVQPGDLWECHLPHGRSTVIVRGPEGDERARLWRVAQVVDGIMGTRHVVRERALLWRWPRMEAV